MCEKEKGNRQRSASVCDDTGVGGQRSSCICERTLGASDDFGKTKKKKSKLSVYMYVWVCVCVCVCTFNAQFYDRPDSAKCEMHLAA